MADWSCRALGVCTARFDSLYELFSYMRCAYPSSGVTCRIGDCWKQYTSPGAWYWHIRKYHGTEYLKGKRKRNHESIECGEAPSTTESSENGNYKN